MSISKLEIIAALFEAQPAMTDAELDSFVGLQGEKMPATFYQFCELLYARGFSHGEHTGRSDAYEFAAKRLACAGQTAGAALIERIGSVGTK